MGVLGWELEGGALGLEGRARARIRWWADYEQVAVEVVGIASILYVEGRRVVDLKDLWVCLFVGGLEVGIECCSDIEQGSRACHGLARFTSNCIL